MIDDNGQTWDLSRNDKVALQWALGELEGEANPPADTVRVRIAVAVDKNGDGLPYIITSRGDGEALAHSVMGLIESMAAAGIIEADLPLMPIVQARVVEGKS